MTDTTEKEILKCCIALRDGRFRSASLLPLPSSGVSLASKMPPADEQSFSSTCAAHAVAALVAYFENPDDPPRLSPQFIFDMVKRSEKAWISKNMDSIRNGFDPDAEFTFAYRRSYEQLKMLIGANGGPKSAASLRFISQFEDQLASQTGVSRGSMIHRCFDVVREYGVCRDELRPSASVQRVSFAGAAGRLEVPGSVMEDAMKHRVVDGLRVFEHPNNVNEIRAMLAGARKLRPMPVCVSVDVFEGCTENGFSFPRIGDDGSFADRCTGLHSVLVVGYEDDGGEPGGGRFLVRNSWGSGWGMNGYGTMPYAYLEIFCREAGTVMAYAGASPRPDTSVRPRISRGEVCGVCGKRYLSKASFKGRCSADGCGAGICFDCWVRLGARTCKEHGQ